MIFDAIKHNAGGRRGTRGASSERGGAVVALGAMISSVAAAALSGLVLTSPAWAETPWLPDVSAVPAITNNLGPSGAFGLPPLNPPPPPKDFTKEASWNLKVVGFMDQLGCQDGDQMWVEHQGSREILYAGSQTGMGVNPITNQPEPCGVQIYDVTNPSNPQFLAHIPGDPAGGGAPHVFVCSGNTLPSATRGSYYLLVHRGATSGPNANARHEIWDVTNPSTPMLAKTIVTNVTQYHRSYWECDTGIAYLVTGVSGDGWRQHQHIYIYDLGNPTNPVFIRQFGLPGGQPGVSPTVSCTNSPGSDCYEGVANPPSSVHQCYSTANGVIGAGGVKQSIVICSYGVGSNGVIQILDRDKLLHGCAAATASASCANDPSQADLLYPQIGYVAQPPYIGSHNSTPIFNMPIPQLQSNFTTSPLNQTPGPQSWDVAINTSEAGGPPSCIGDQYMHNTTLVDVTNQQTPWPIATLNVPQFPGNFCQKGGRFGSHYYQWHIYAPYYGKLACVTWFSAGMRCFDIRDPLNPRMVAYYLQAPNENTRQSCGVPGNPGLCQFSTYMNVVEVDDRGLIYGQDRAGSGITILQPTGDAIKVVTGSGNQGNQGGNGGS